MIGYNFAVLFCSNLRYASLIFALQDLKLFKYFDFISAVALTIGADAVT